MMKKIDEEEFFKLFYKVNILEKGTLEENKRFDDYIKGVKKKVPMKNIDEIAKMRPSEFKDYGDDVIPLLSAEVAKRCLIEYQDIVN